MPIPRVCCQTLTGHVGPVHIITFNSGSTYLLSAGADRTIRIWNAESGNLVKAYSGGHGKEVLGLDVSFDNARFCSSSADKAVFQWDVSSGKVLRRFNGHTHRVNTVVFNGEATVIISGSYDATTRIWDVKSQSHHPIQILKEAKDDITSVRINQHEILTGSVDGHVRVYDLRMGRLIADNVGYPVTSACFSGDGNCLLVSSLDSTIRLFDKENGEMLSDYTGHKNDSYKLTSCLTNADSHVVSGSEDGRICFWDLVEGSMIKSFPAHSKVVECVVYHEKEDILASCSADGTIKIWKPEP